MAANDRVRGNVVEVGPIKAAGLNHWNRMTHKRMAPSGGCIRWNSVGFRRTISELDWRPKPTREQQKPCAMNFLSSCSKPALRVCQPWVASAASEKTPVPLRHKFDKAPEGRPRTSKTITGKNSQQAKMLSSRHRRELECRQQLPHAKGCTADQSMKKRSQTFQPDLSCYLS
jgi:hypothetical protein